MDLRDFDSYLPPLPTSASRLIELTQTDAEISEMEEVILLDPSLTANILRISNSPFYHPGGDEISSVKQAIVRLGYKLISDLSISSTVWKHIPSTLVGYPIDWTLYQSHCIAVAVISEQLAEALNVGPIEGVFTAGLLHDIGKILISQELNQNKALLRQFIYGAHNLHGETEIFLEKELLGFNHAELGAEVSQYWNFPVKISEAIRQHHTPEQGFHSTNRYLLNFVHASNVMAHMMEYGDPSRVLATGVSEDLITGMPISFQVFEDIGRKIPRRIRKMLDLLDL